VLRLRPVRDARGVPVVPAHVTFGTGSDRGGVVPVDAGWLATCLEGDTIQLHDTRGSARIFVVTAYEPGRVDAEVWDTTYLETGVTLHNRGRTTRIRWLPPVEQFLVLSPGDQLRVTAGLAPVAPWRTGMAGTPAIGCSRPEVFGAVRPGHRVMLDDGKFTGVVESTASGEFTIRIRSGPSRGARLRSDKGMNVPDTDLPIPIVGDDDLPLLDVAAAYGELLGLSFLRNEADVDAVLERLDGIGADRLGLILKIETIRGFERLPAILLRAMQRPRVGVMIARGDLAVESSFERLAEVQEEILWLCEAAHVPVVWATEVLDQLARTGRPSRAEITDAAMAQRAECVMLNKGPYVDVAIETLDDILRRMAGHQRKKAALLRPLRSWNGA
jgi:pyruvate kinase